MGRLLGESTSSPSSLTVALAVSQGLTELRPSLTALKISIDALTRQIQHQSRCMGKGRLRLILCVQGDGWGGRLVAICGRCALVQLHSKS
jgi:hypothetical protein